MPGKLFDSNVWIGSLFVAHPAHQQAKGALMEATPAEPAIFCRSTEQSFLRLASSPLLLKAYGAASLTNRDAWMALETWLQLPQVCQRQEPPGLEALWHQLATRDSPCPKLWMDAYLAAFAIAGGLQLVTFDHDFKTFEPQGLRLLLLG